MWEINLGKQLLAFAVSILLGGVLCTLYGVFSAFRRANNSGKIWVIIQDIVYFSVSAVITFVFLSALTNGEVRGYFILGELTGFALIKISFYKIFVKALIKVNVSLKKALSLISDVNYRILAAIYKLISKNIKKMQKIFKKIIKTS